VKTRALRLGTRGSRLALWQAESVAKLLQAAGDRVDIIIIKTSGDRLQTRPLTESGTKRLFVKEIEDALLGADVDLAVHSAKDMPAVLPEGLDIAAALPREDPHDALVLPATRAGSGVHDLPSALALLGEDPSIGTSSVRRRAQLASLVKGATFGAIRGNVDTRLAKLDGGEYDGLVLAAAGMRRLGVDRRISATLPFDVCIPAPGQGIIAVEVRADDADTRRAVGRLDDPVSGAVLAAERALVEALGGGCQLPLGGIAVQADGGLEMRAAVMSLDGGRVIRASRRGSAADPEALGRQLAEELAASGAAEILEEVRRGQ
jgi:hydroxymethylbilane synthase